MKSDKKKEIKDFFDTLKAECLKDDVFSVIETAEKMGVSYDKVRAWARSSKSASQILKECRTICWNHCFDKTEEGELTKKLSTGDALKYMEENNDEYREQQEKFEAECNRSSLQREAERKGKEFPPDKLEIEGIEVDRITAEEAKQIARVSKNKIVSEKTPLAPQTLEDIEAERIKEWKEKEKRTTPSFYIKQTITEDETGKKNLIITREPTGQDPLTHEQLESTFYATTGSANRDYALKLLTQIASGCFRSTDEDIKIYTAKTFNESTGVLLSLAPKDEIEGMLCARLLVLNDQAMQYMARAAAPEQTHAGIDLNINRATKLMRLYNETLDALNKHRRKGEQKVTVQHVNVNNGGQAVVNGQLNQGEGEHGKK